MANPLTFIILQARDVLIWGITPDWLGLGIYIVVSIAIASVGFAWFQKPERALRMSSDELAIDVCNLSKRYEIYDAPRERLKQFILPRLQRKLNLQARQYFREFWALKNVSFEVKKGKPSVLSDAMAVGNPPCFK